jgi:hypothetical protein
MSETATDSGPVSATVVLVQRVVALLTWLLMPLANRAFGFWLNPTRGRGRFVELRGIAVIVVGYALAIAIFLAFG